MNEIESMIAELYFGKIHAYNRFNFSNLCPIKSYGKLRRKLLADKDLCGRFYWLFLEIDQ